MINPDPEGQELINGKLVMTEDLGHVFVAYALWLWFIVAIYCYSTAYCHRGRIDNNITILMYYFLRM